MDKLDIIKNFSQLFDFKKERDELELIKEKDKIIYVDKADNIGIQPNIKSVKNILEKNFDSKEIPPLKIDYSYDNDKEQNEVIIGVEFLKTALKLCMKTEDESVGICVKKDNPITFKTTEMNIVVADREVEDEQIKLDHTDIKSCCAELSILLKKKGIKDKEIRKIHDHIISLLV